MSSKPTVLLTGATGFIGAAVAHRLADEGYPLLCIVRRTSDRSRLNGLDERALIVVDDFTHLGAALAGRRIDAVIHLAAYGVAAGQRDPLQMLDGNLLLITQLLQACSSHPIQRVLMAGSCFEYGDAPANCLIDENHAVRPASLYGAAKAGSVLYGTALARDLKLPLTTLRLFGTYGPGESSQRLIPYLIRKLEAGVPVDLTDGMQVRDLLFINDAVDAILTALTSPRLAPFEAYNVCSSQPIRIRDVGNRIADALDRPRSLLHWGARPARPDEQPWIVGDNSKLTKATGWRPTTTLADGARRCIESLRVGWAA